MKKIDGGYGGELEVSDELEVEVDPDSMLDEQPIIQNIANVSKEIEEEQLIAVILLSSTNPDGVSKKYNINAIIKKISFSMKELSCEFIMLRKTFLTIEDFPWLILNKIEILCNGAWKDLKTRDRQIQKIEFESFGKNIKCSITAA